MEAALQSDSERSQAGENRGDRPLVNGLSKACERFYLSFFSKKPLHGCH